MTRRFPWCAYEVAADVAVGGTLPGGVMMGRAWATRAAVVAGAVGVAGLISPTVVASAGTGPARATAETVGQGLATAARPSTERASTSRGHAHRCRLPVFGPGRSYHPRIDPKSFTAKVTNPWFPLVVGRTMVYTGVKDGKRALNVVVVSRHVKRIDRVL